MKNPLKFFKQKTNTWCGPAVLQTVFYYYGQNVSQKELSLFLKTNKNGTSHKDLIKISKKFGFKTFSKSNSKLSDLIYYNKKDCPIIVNYLEPEKKEGHYAIVTKITKNNLIVQDPYHGADFKISKKYFLKNWVSEDKKNKRWFLIIEKK